MTFHPTMVWSLLLLLVIPVAWWWWRRRATRPGVTFSSLDAARAAGPTWAVRLRWIVPALRTLALAILIVCVARPRQADERTQVVTEGIAIQLVVDRSGSMEIDDFELDGRRATRLDVVKHVIESFVTGGEDLPGRPNDLIGMIAFGTYADSTCPLTLDHEHLVTALRQTRVSHLEEERGTAIGDALALGVERIRGLDDRGDFEGDRRIKSRVMILLTDGVNTAGDLDPLTAAKMAEAFGITVHTIGAGSPGRSAAESFDEETLREIADLTGGRTFRATDRSSLEEVYRRIDALERSKIEQQQYTEYAEWSVRAVTLGAVTMPALLAVALVLMAGRMVLEQTRFRSLP